MIMNNNEDCVISISDNTGNNNQVTSQCQCNYFLIQVFVNFFSYRKHEYSCLNADTYYIKAKKILKKSTMIIKIKFF